MKMAEEETLKVRSFGGGEGGGGRKISLEFVRLENFV